MKSASGLKQYAEHSYLFGILGLTLCLPMRPVATPLFVIFIVLGWIFSDGLITLKEDWNRLSTSTKLMLVIWPIYFLLHVIGLIHTDNMGFAFLDLGIKVPLFIVPPVILLKGIRENQAKWIFNTLLISVLLSIIYINCRAIFEYAKGAGLGAFTGYDFSRLLHVGYFGLILLAGLSVVLHHLLCLHREWTIWKRFAFVSIACIFGCTIIQTGSKASFIILIVLLILAYFRLVRQSQKKRLVIGIGLTGIALLCGLYFGGGNLKSRMDRMVDATINAPLNKNSLESTMARRMTWESSMTLIKEHPIVGVGTGDVKDELVKNYALKGYTAVYDKQLNSHNQYLNSWVALGIAAPLSMLLAFSVLLFQGIKRKHFMVIAFAVACLLAFFTESMIERQRGVMILVLLYPVMAVVVGREEAKI